MNISRAVTAMRHWRARLSSSRWLLLVSVLLMSGCRYATHISFLDAQGPIAVAERWHFYWVLAILGVLVAGPIFLAMPFVMWHYRYRNKKAKYAPKWQYNRPIEIATWAGPIVIVCILGWLVWQNAHRLDPYRPIASNEPALQVQVVGYNWKWLFIYPKLGIATIGMLAMPVDRPVAMHLTSATVMQSFFIPSLGSQIYAMGGMVTQLHLEASHAGKFLGENTMYNGDGFHHQKFTAVAMSRDKFDAWVRYARTNGVRLDSSILNAIAQRSTRKQLIGQLPAAAAHHDTVYLTGMTPQFFPAVVRASLLGTRVQLGHGSVPTHAGTVQRPPVTKIKGHTK